MIAKNLLYQAVVRRHPRRFVTASEMLNDLVAQDGTSALQRRLARYCSPHLSGGRRESAICPTMTTAMPTCSSKWSPDATACAPPSSPPTSPSPSGTRSSPTLPASSPSSIVSSTMPRSSRSTATPTASRKPGRKPRNEPRSAPHGDAADRDPHHLAAQDLLRRRGPPALLPAARHPRPAPSSRPPAGRRARATTGAARPDPRRLPPRRRPPCLLAERAPARDPLPALLSADPRRASSSSHSLPVTSNTSDNDSAPPSAPRRFSSDGEPRSSPNSSGFTQPATAADSAIKSVRDSGRGGRIPVRAPGVLALD